MFKGPGRLSFKTLPKRSDLFANLQSFNGFFINFKFIKLFELEEFLMSFNFSPSSILDRQFLLKLSFFFSNLENEIQILLFMNVFTSDEIYYIFSQPSVNCFFLMRQAFFLNKQWANVIKLKDNKKNIVDLYAGFRVVMECYDNFFRNIEDFYMKFQYKMQISNNLNFKFFMVDSSFFSKFSHKKDGFSQLDFKYIFFAKFISKLKDHFLWLLRKLRSTSANDVELLKNEWVFFFVKFLKEFNGFEEIKTKFFLGSNNKEFESFVCFFINIFYYYRSLCFRLFSFFLKGNGFNFGCYKEIYRIFNFFKLIYESYKKFHLYSIFFRKFFKENLFEYSIILRAYIIDNFKCILDKMLLLNDFSLSYQEGSLVFFHSKYNKSSRFELRKSNSLLLNYFKYNNVSYNKKLRYFFVNRYLFIFKYFDFFNRFSDLLIFFGEETLFSYNLISCFDRNKFRFNVFNYIYELLQTYGINFVNYIKMCFSFIPFYYELSRIIYLPAVKYIPRDYRIASSVEDFFQLLEESGIVEGYDYFVDNEWVNYDSTRSPVDEYDEDDADIIPMIFEEEEGRTTLFDALSIMTVNYYIDVSYFVSYDTFKLLDYEDNFFFNEKVYDQFVDFISLKSDDFRESYYDRKLFLTLKYYWSYYFRSTADFKFLNKENNEVLMKDAKNYLKIFYNLYDKVYIDWKYFWYNFFSNFDRLTNRFDTLLDFFEFYVSILVDEFSVDVESYYFWPGLYLITYDLTEIGNPYLIAHEGTRFGVGDVEFAFYDLYSTFFDGEEFFDEDEFNFDFSNAIMFQEEPFELIIDEDEYDEYLKNIDFLDYDSSFKSVSFYDAKLTEDVEFYSERIFSIFDNSKFIPKNLILYVNWLLFNVNGNFRNLFKLYESSYNHKNLVFFHDFDIADWFNADYIFRGLNKHEFNFFKKTFKDRRFFFKDLFLKKKLNSNFISFFRKYKKIFFFDDCSLNNSKLKDCYLIFLFRGLFNRLIKSIEVENFIDFEYFKFFLFVLPTLFYLKFFNSLCTKFKLSFDKLSFNYEILMGFLFQLSIQDTVEIFREVELFMVQLFGSFKKGLIFFKFKKINLCFYKKVLKLNFYVFFFENCVYFFSKSFFLTEAMLKGDFKSLRKSFLYKSIYDMSLTPSLRSYVSTLVNYITNEKSFVRELSDNNYLQWLGNLSMKDNYVKVDMDYSTELKELQRFRCFFKNNYFKYIDLFRKSYVEFESNKDLFFASLGIDVSFLQENYDFSIILDTYISDDDDISSSDFYSVVDMDPESDTRTDEWTEHFGDLGLIIEEEEMDDEEFRDFIDELDLDYFSYGMNNLNNFLNSFDETNEFKVLYPKSHRIEIFLFDFYKKILNSVRAHILELYAQFDKNKYISSLSGRFKAYDFNTKFAKGKRINLNYEIVKEIYEYSFLRELDYFVEYMGDLSEYGMPLTREEILDGFLRNNKDLDDNIYWLDGVKYYSNELSFNFLEANWLKFRLICRVFYEYGVDDDSYFLRNFFFKEKEDILLRKIINFYFNGFFFKKKVLSSFIINMNIPIFNYIIKKLKIFFYDQKKLKIEFVLKYKNWTYQQKLDYFLLYDVDDFNKKKNSIDIYYLINIYDMIIFDSGFRLLLGDLFFFEIIEKVKKFKLYLNLFKGFLNTFSILLLIDQVDKFISYIPYISNELLWFKIIEFKNNLQREEFFFFKYKYELFQIFIKYGVSEVIIHSELKLKYDVLVDTLKIPYFYKFFYFFEEFLVFSLFFFLLMYFFSDISLLNFIDYVYYFNRLHPDEDYNLKYYIYPRGDRVLVEEFYHRWPGLW